MLGVQGHVSLDTGYCLHTVVGVSSVDCADNRRVLGEHRLEVGFAIVVVVSGVPPDHELAVGSAAQSLGVYTAAWACIGTGHDRHEVIVVDEQGVEEVTACSGGVDGHAAVVEEGLDGAWCRCHLQTAVRACTYRTDRGAVNGHGEGQHYIGSAVVTACAINASTACDEGSCCRGYGVATTTTRNACGRWCRCNCACGCICDTHRRCACGCCRDRSHYCIGAGRGRRNNRRRWAVTTR